MTRIVGLLSWYDENPAWLKDAITSYYRCGLTHLVAVDGAYFLLEGGRPRSARKQAKAIVDTCDSLGIGLTLHQPAEVWGNNEIEKRSFLFQLAEQITDESDWYVVIDADEVVEKAVNLQHELRDVEELAVSINLVERYDADDPLVKANPGMPPETTFPIRKVFRALRGLHCDGNHFTYRSGDRLLWTNGDVGAVDCFEMPLMLVWHRTRERNLARHRQQHAYYSRREEVGAEKSHGTKCSYCDAPADKTVDGNPQRLADGTILTDRVPVCGKHWKRPLWDTNMTQLLKDRKGLGADFTPEELHNLNTERRVNRYAPR